MRLEPTEHHTIQTQWLNAKLPGACCSLCLSVQGHATMQCQITYQRSYMLLNRITMQAVMASHLHESKVHSLCRRGLTCQRAHTNANLHKSNMVSSKETCIIKHGHQSAIVASALLHGGPASSRWQACVPVQDYNRKQS